MRFLDDICYPKANRETYGLREPFNAKTNDLNNHTLSIKNATHLPNQLPDV